MHPLPNKHSRIHSIDAETRQKIPPTSFPFPLRTRNQESPRFPPVPLTWIPLSACGYPKCNYIQPPQRNPTQSLPHFPSKQNHHYKSEFGESSIACSSRLETPIPPDSFSDPPSDDSSTLQIAFHFARSDRQSPSDSRNHYTPTPSLPAIPAIISQPRTHSPNPTQTHVHPDSPPSPVFPRDSPSLPSPRHQPPGNSK